MKGVPRMNHRLKFSTELREAFAMAVNAIAAHKLRSSLTLLGILIGVFSIIVVSTAIRALQSNIESEMAQLGSHTFQLQRFPAIQVDDNNEGVEKYLRRKRFYLPIVKALQERVSLAKHVAASTQTDSGEVLSRFGKTAPTVALMGMSPEAFETRNLTVAEGRSLTETDMDSARHVTVLGAEVAAKLFPFGGALGDWVRFKDAKYSVVGVLESKGSMFGQSRDNFIAVPITTILNRYGRETSVQIQVQATGEDSFNDTVEQTRGALRAVRKVPPGAEDDFEIVSNDSLINQFRSITLAVRAGAGIISSIALLAAGIGIMNIMLVSVTERTKEIGIRRAIGAKKRNIMTQFILEAIVLCQIGGVLGIVLGIGAGNLAAAFLKTPPVVPWDSAAIGLVVCSLVGIVFGTYPAWKAANLDPIESLRYE
ncbi:MAG: ABC transporter permease [Verrucomicrobiales bacterium]|nr:ABC transporter permease [Verrucomicrobiales bacterium]